MYTMTACFLIYSGTSFAQMEYMLFSLTGAILGSDVALFRSNDLSGMEIALEEQKLTNFFDKNLFNQSDKSGLITKYGYLGQSINNMLMDERQEKLWIGIGMKDSR